MRIQPMNKDLFEALKTNDIRRLEKLIADGIISGDTLERTEDDCRTGMYSRTEDGLTAFLVAVSYGHIEMVEYLLKKEYTYGGERNNHKSALLIAVENGQTKMVDYLIKKGLSRVEESDNTGATALLLAVTTNQPKMVDHLLNNKHSRRDEKNYRDFSALMLAVENGQIEMFNHLIKNKYSEINERTLDGETALLVAAANGQIAMFEHLLKNKYSQVNEKNNKGATALIVAASHGQIAMVDHLLSNKYSQINEKSNEGYTAFLVAAARGKIKMVDHLLKKEHSEKNARDNYGNTALLLATVFGQTEMVHHLLKMRYSEKDERNNAGYSALLMLASSEFYGETEMLDSLLDKLGADIQDTSKDGQNVLTLSARPFNSSLFNYFLEKGAYLDMPLKNGKTLSYLTANKINRYDSLSYGYTSFYDAERLLEISQRKDTYETAYNLDNLFGSLGKAVNGRQFETGNTALHFAILNKKTDLVKRLLHAGADITMPNRKGETPIQLLGASKHPYLCLLHSYCALRQIEKNKTAGKGLELLKEVKERKETKETKDVKEVKEFKELKETKGIEEICGKLLENFTALSNELSVEEMQDIGLKILKLFIDDKSPLFDPDRAYQFLNSFMSKENVKINRQGLEGMLYSVTLMKAKKQELEIEKLRQENEKLRQQLASNSTPSILTAFQTTVSTPATNTASVQKVGEPAKSLSTV